MRLPRRANPSKNFQQPLDITIGEHEAVYFAANGTHDIYLTGKVSLERLSRAEVDRILGVVAETADASFNSIVELGFAESIRREWVWRRSRGESTANLEAFRHLDPGPEA